MEKGKLKYDIVDFVFFFICICKLFLRTSKAVYAL